MNTKLLDKMTENGATKITPRGVDPGAPARRRNVVDRFGSLTYERQSTDTAVNFHFFLLFVFRVGAVNILPIQPYCSFTTKLAGRR